jgi:hypothetical protein
MKAKEIVPRSIQESQEEVEEIHATVARIKNAMKALADAAEGGDTVAYQMLCDFTERGKAMLAAVKRQPAPVINTPTDFQRFCEERDKMAQYARRRQKACCGKAYNC